MSEEHTQLTEKIWECTRCGKAKEVMGTVGGIE